MNEIKAIEASQMTNEPSGFKVGDSVKVHFKIVEGKTARTPAYEGLVISMKNSGVGKSFTVRKMSYGTGVERIFPINSPRYEKIEVLTSGKVRRSRLYFVRNLRGKKARLETERELRASARSNIGDQA